jgi:hypothetical protein
MTHGNTMNKIIKNIKLVKLCKVYEKNATERGYYDLAKQARQRSIEIRVQEHGTKNNVESQCLSALFAYEDTMSFKGNKIACMGNILPIIKKQGIIKAVENLMRHFYEPKYFETLKGMGLETYSLALVVVNFPIVFSTATVLMAHQCISLSSSYKLAA